MALLPPRSGPCLPLFRLDLLNAGTITSSLLALLPNLAVLWIYKPEIGLRFAATVASIADLLSSPLRPTAMSNTRMFTCSAKPPTFKKFRKLPACEDLQG